MKILATVPGVPEYDEDADQHYRGLVVRATDEALCAEEYITVWTLPGDDPAMLLYVAGEWWAPERVYLGEASLGQWLAGHEEVREVVYRRVPEKTCGEHG